MWFTGCFLPSGISSSFCWCSSTHFFGVQVSLDLHHRSLHHHNHCHCHMPFLHAPLGSPSTAKRKTTLPDTNITTENGGLEDYLSGAIFASGRVTIFIGWLLFGIFPQWPKKWSPQGREVGPPLPLYRPNNPVVLLLDVPTFTTWT